MIEITASDIGDWEQIVRQAQTETLKVQSHGNPTVYVLGVEEYQDLQQIKKELLEANLQKGIEQMDAGQFTTYTEETAGDLVERIKARATKRLKP